MRNIRPFCQALILIVSGSMFGACAFGGSRSTPIPTSVSLATHALGAVPSGSGYAYVADDANAGHEYVYALPLTARSQPLWEILTNFPGATGFYGRRVFIAVTPLGYIDQGILVYAFRKDGPVSFLIPTVDVPVMLVVDAHGDIFQGQTYRSSSYASYQINVYLSPITKKSTPAFTINASVNHVGSNLSRGLAFDPHGNLWVKDDDNQTMDKYVPPFSSNSIPKLTFTKGYGAPYGSLIFDANSTMFVTNGNGVDVYKPPFTKRTKKRFTIPVPGATNSLAVDASGYLYVTAVASSDENVYVFVPPFSASSLPQVTMRIPGAPNIPFIAIKQ